MKIYLGLCAVALCGSFSSLSAVSVRTPVVSVDVGGGYPRPGYYVYYDDAYYQVWVGPGWYYGVWFDNEAAYYDWLDNRFYTVVWAGPGWYYGYWFESEGDYDYYRRSHTHYHSWERHKYEGRRDWHEKERHGEWNRDKKSGKRNG